MSGEATIRRFGMPGDLGWVVKAHGEIYAREFGWNVSFEAWVARIMADFAGSEDSARQAGWIAELDGRRVGCILCAAENDTAKLRVLLVHPDGRGHRLGTRLTAECIVFARAEGYARVRLWTVDTLVAARHIYLAAGFVLVEESPHRNFGVEVIGQIYELDLANSVMATAADENQHTLPS